MQMNTASLRIELILFCKVAFLGPIERFPR